MRVWCVRMRAPTHLALGGLSHLSQLHQLTTSALDADHRHRHSETRGACVICAQYYKQQISSIINTISKNTMFKNNKWPDNGIIQYRLKM